MGNAYFIGKVPLDAPTLRNHHEQERGKRGPNDWDRDGWKSWHEADAHMFLLHEASIGEV